MTENTSPAGPEGVPLSLGPESSRHGMLQDRRALGVIGIAVAAVAALGFFVVLPSLNHSSAKAAAAVSHGHPRNATQVTVVRPAARIVAATPAPALVVRDPFSPLFVAPTAVASPSPTLTTASATPPTIIIVQPTQSSSGPSSYSLTVVKVSDANHVVATLNGVTYKLVVGQDFPDAAKGPFQIMKAVVGGTVTFAYGDSTFGLLAGQSRTFAA